VQSRTTTNPADGLILNLLSVLDDVGSLIGQMGRKMLRIELVI